MNLIKQYYCYILASRKNGTLYTGVTSDLVRRAYEHKIGVVEGFTQKYGVTQLVWYEVHQDVESAIAREKQIKKWERAWKINLIELHNPGWNDLYPELTGSLVEVDSRLRGNDIRICGNGKVFSQQRK